ncbi:MAG: methyl-accepting chemotaxis protein [Cellvibrionaceae bacterium]|nr:methyl-accepting chemotaxis protein [Cellvibrionaceae bacterium]
MSLRIRITLAALTGLLLLAISLVITLNKVASVWFERYASSSLQASESLFHSIVSSRQDAMEAELQAITRDRKIRKMVASSNAEGLYEEAAPSFRRLSASGVLNKQQLFNTAGELLFSLPEDQPDKTQKAIIKQVLTDKKVLRGIERDGDQLMVAVAFPLLQRGKLVGAGLFLQNVDEALALLKKINGSEVGVLGEDWVLQSSTSADFFKNLDLAGVEKNTASYVEIAVQDKIYGTSVVPIMDFSLKPAGYLIQAINQTEKVQQTATIEALGYGASAIIFILIGLSVFWYVRRAFKPIAQAIAMTKAVAKGDLSVTIEHCGHDEIGSMMLSVADMVSHLRTMVARLLPIASHLAQSCTHLEKTADESNKGVAIQVAENKHIAAAIDELKTIALHVANHSVKTAENASRADSDTKKVQAIVGDSIKSIYSLNEKMQVSANTIGKLQNETTQIETVLDVIKSIAEQTNLLALNAAIEAARAGEQGRGFAVVADEVRSLAGRTQQSTADINNMIENLQRETNDTVVAMESSIQQVQQSVEAITESGEALGIVSNAISEITEMNALVADSTEKQRLLVATINQHIVEVVSVTDGNKQHIASTSQASDQLNQLACELSALSDQFTL